MSAPRVAVLGYHRIGPPPPGGWETWWFVPAEVFDAHLRTLAEDGWAPLDVDAFLAGLHDPATLPERSVLVTFDDGYRSMVEHALPVLGRHGCPSVLFVPTDHVGATNEPFDPWEPREPLCTWEDLALLDDAGMAVESHAASHRAFSDLGADEQLAEAVRSREALEERLGKRVRLLAYPFGDRGDAPDLASAGFEAAFVYPGGTLTLPLEDRFGIERVAVGPDTDLRAELGG